MATNGIISVMKDNKVVFKCIAGCNGMTAETTAKAIKEIENPTLDNIYKTCLDYAFGCKECLVVQSETGHKFIDQEDDLHELYIKKFTDPNFNPRWERGTAAHTEIINL